MSAKSRYFPKLAQWMDGADVSASAAAMRFEGDIMWHRNSGSIQAFRTPGVVYVRAGCVAEARSPSDGNGGFDIRTACLGKWHSRELWSYPRDPVTGHYSRVKKSEAALHEWPPPKAEVVPVPGYLLDLLLTEPLNSGTVDLATRLEHARLQRVVLSRQKYVPKGGGR